MVRALFLVPIALLAIKYGKPYLERLGNEVSIKIVGFGLPELGNNSHFPINVQFHNPTIIPVSITELKLSVHKANNGQWNQVAQTEPMEPFTLQAGNTELPVNATINLGNLWGSWLDQINYLTGQDFLITATGKAEGIPINYEIIQNVKLNV